MVQRRKRFWALLCLLAMVGMLLLSMDASAAGSKGVGICVSFGESEEIRNAAPGIPIVVGDNRDRSDDSRVSLGFVPLENMVGKAQILFFSHNDKGAWYKPWTWHKTIRWSRLFNRLH